MKKRLGALLFVVAILAAFCGCDQFVDITQMVIKLSVNGSEWTAGSPIETRPDYERGAVMVTIEAAGGDPRTDYSVVYKDTDGTHQRSFETATTLELRVNQTFTIRDGSASPISYQLVIINNAPIVLSPWLSDAKPEMGEHLRLIAYYYQHGTCPTIEDPTFTGCYDADEEYGDKLSIFVRVTGPEKGNWDDWIQYRLYDDLPGTNDYAIITETWVPGDTVVHFFLGYDEKAPGIGALSAKSGGCGDSVFALGCGPDPTDPIVDPAHDSGEYVYVEVWVKDIAGAMAYGKYKWPIYINGCP